MKTYIGSPEARQAGHHLRNYNGDQAFAHFGVF
jgi:hypothetical protein